MAEDGLKEPIYEDVRFVANGLWNDVDTSCGIHCAENLVTCFSEIFKGVFVFGYDFWGKGSTTIDDCCVKTLQKLNYIDTYESCEGNFYTVFGSRLLDLPPVFPKIHSRNSFSKSKRFRILDRDGFKCVYCGTSPRENEIHIDHKIPLCKGGTNNDDNLVASCMECNLGKGSNMLLNEPEIDTEGLNEYMDNLSKTIGRS